MDFKKLIIRYNQFGGFRLVIEYAKLGVLGTIVKGFFRCLAKRQSFKGIYPEVLKKVEPFLTERYAPFVQEFKVQANTNCTNDTNNKVSRIRELEKRPIWFCWLQGIDNAPDIVRACYNSLNQHLSDWEIKVIDNKNWKEYVDMPDYIVKKWEKGRIPAALFSDLLRLELLIKYGGTWIDSTVLCTGFNDNHNENDNKSRIGELENKAKQYLDADLFLFQYTKQGSIPVSISNWFITACSNNEVLMALGEMLCAYWKDYDCTLDYYIFHLFFSMLSKEYPEEIAKMPYGQSMNSLVLLHHMGERFEQKKWDKLTSQVCFHKLAFRIPKEIEGNEDNYYNYILNTNKTNCTNI